jgi:uncharacterized membrane protein HdeD (DUF308 family)
MLDALLVVAGIAIQLYGIFDCARTDQESVRNLPKWGWLLIVIILGLFGSIAWFLAGRPRTAGSGRVGRSGPIAPDDDDDFLRKL